MTDKIAIFSDHGLYDGTLGRLESGYTILTQQEAEQWMRVTPSVRTATPAEVAAAYGV